MPARAFSSPECIPTARSDCYGRGNGTTSATLSGRCCGRPSMPMARHSQIMWIAKDDEGIFRINCWCTVVRVSRVDEMDALSGASFRLAVARFIARAANGECCKKRRSLNASYRCTAVVEPHTKISLTGMVHPGTTSPPSNESFSVNITISVSDRYTATVRRRGITTRTMRVPASSQSKTFSCTSV